MCGTCFQADSTSVYTRCIYYIRAVVLLECCKNSEGLSVWTCIAGVISSWKVYNTHKCMYECAHPYIFKCILFRT